VRITAGDVPSRAETLTLYDAVGWTAYTRDPDALMRAVAQSHLVVTARDGTRLVGLARTISDGVTVCFLQDLLVLPTSQRSGVGRALVGQVLRAYAHCRQVLLMTDVDGPAQFYRSVGFTPLASQGLAGYALPPA
jgi:predicted N-acetyltransferase YhbS